MPETRIPRLRTVRTTLGGVRFDGHSPILLRRNEQCSFVSCRGIQFAAGSSADSRSAAQRRLLIGPPLLTRWKVAEVVSRLSRPGRGGSSGRARGLTDPA